MARQLADSTVDRFRRRLADERDRLSALLEEHEQEREEARLSETSAERTPDPNTAEGGSMAFEFEKDLSIDANAEDLLRKVEHALERVDAGTYGICENCGNPIPVARLTALPYASLDVECARR
ncbi:MAG: TraR/DksA family transcriptional regulator [Acidimicrobiia bacterium]